MCIGSAVFRHHSIGNKIMYAIGGVCSHHQEHLKCWYHWAITRCSLWNAFWENSKICLYSRMYQEIRLLISNDFQREHWMRFSLKRAVNQILDLIKFKNCYGVRYFFFLFTYPLRKNNKLSLQNVTPRFLKRAPRHK